MKNVCESSTLLHQAHRRLWFVRISVILIIGVLAGVAVNKHSMPLLLAATILSVLVVKTKNLKG